MIYLKLFHTFEEYNTYKTEASGYRVPNVSLISGETKTMAFNPKVVVETKYNVTDTTNPTQIGGVEYISAFTEIEVDGTALPSLVSAYTFSTTGEHTVKYALRDATSIGFAAFYRCSGMTSVVIPDSVTSIGNNAFVRCSGLTSCTIGSGVTSIGQEAFDSCSSLTSVTIPNSVTSIDNGAFATCKGLTSIDIPSGVTSIADNAFYACTTLSSVTVDSGNTVYDSRNNCNAIIETSTNKLFIGCKSTVIPNSVTSIGRIAFSSCSSLTSIVIPNSVTSIGSNAFYNCISLTSCTIGSGVTSIGQKAFCRCSGLTSIDIPNSVTNIDDSAFWGCSGLTSCTIGSGVTKIGFSVFQECSDLTSVTVNAITPPTLGSNVFKSTNDCPIYVPSGSVEDYKAATNWKSLASRIKAIP